MTRPHGVPGRGALAGAVRCLESRLERGAKSTEVICNERSNRFERGLGFQERAFILL